VVTVGENRVPEKQDMIIYQDKLQSFQHLDMLIYTLTDQHAKPWKQHEYMKRP
jgi:hypothetical protein